MYSIEIKGLDKLIRNFNKAPDLISREISEAIRKSSIYIQRISKSESPYRTGNLRRSITINTQPLVGRIYPTAPYAIFVEFGTRFMRANPFMGRARDKTQPIVREYFNRVIEKVVKEL